MIRSTLREYILKKVIGTLAFTGIWAYALSYYFNISRSLLSCNIGQLCFYQFLFSVPN